MGRKLGQHFLVSQSILERILEAAAVAPGEPILEVGPGRGALTEKLRAAGAAVTAVELDPALAAALRERWPDDGRFRLVEGDILKVSLAADALFSRGRMDGEPVVASRSGSLAAPVPEGGDAPYAVIANLPYYLTTPLLFRFVRERWRFARLLLMVQHEVAERLAAAPADGHAYGSLSIAAQVAFAVRIVMRVPPGAFHPRPKVDSAVVELRPLPPVLPAGEELDFLQHVKGLFSQRRKRMAGTLRRSRPPWPEAALGAALALVGERRPEALSPAEHVAVYRALRGRPGP